MTVDKYTDSFTRSNDLNLNPSTQSMTVRVDSSLNMQVLDFEAAHVKAGKSQK